MRTSLDLPDSLFEEAKARAVQQGVTVEEMLATCIEAGLRGPQRLEEEMVHGKNAHPLPVAWEADGTVTPARSNAELYAILEEEELGGLADGC
jgi:hypothetical protein